MHKAERERLSALQGAALHDPEGALDEYCQLLERFENRLTRRNLRLAERYIDGNLNLFIHARWLGTIDFRIVCQGINGSSIVRNAGGGREELASRGRIADHEISLRANAHKGHPPSHEGLRRGPLLQE